MYRWTLERHAPPSQNRRWPPSATMDASRLPQLSQTKSPSSVRVGGPLWPDRYRLPHAPQSVAGPFGPGFFPEHSSALHWHLRGS